MVIKFDFDDDGEDDLTLKVPLMVKYAPLIKVVLTTLGVAGSYVIYCQAF